MPKYSLPLFSVLFLLVFSMPLRAADIENQGSALVLDLKVKGAPPELSGRLTAGLKTHLEKYGKFNIVPTEEFLAHLSLEERERVDQYNKEMERVIIVNGYKERPFWISLGKTLNVSYIIRGNVQSLDNLSRIHLEKYDVATQKYHQSYGYCYKLENLDYALEKAVKNLLGLSSGQDLVRKMKERPILADSLLPQFIDGERHGPFMSLSLGPEVYFYNFQAQRTEGYESEDENGCYSSAVGEYKFGYIIASHFQIFAHANYALGEKNYERFLVGGGLGYYFQPEAPSGYLQLKYEGGTVNLPGKKDDDIDWTGDSYYFGGGYEFKKHYQIDFGLALMAFLNHSPKYYEARRQHEVNSKLTTVRIMFTALMY